MYPQGKRPRQGSAWYSALISNFESVCVLKRLTYAILALLDYYIPAYGNLGVEFSDIL